jgi:hypothetical protein
VLATSLEVPKHVKGKTQGAAQKMVFDVVDNKPEEGAKQVEGRQDRKREIAVHHVQKAWTRRYILRFFPSREERCDSVLVSHVLSFFRWTVTSMTVRANSKGEAPRVALDEQKGSKRNKWRKAPEQEKIKKQNDRSVLMNVRERVRNILPFGR